MKFKYLFPLLLFMTTLFSCTKEEILNNKPPTAIVSDSVNVSVSENEVVELRGSGSDSDGQVVGYLWSQVSGPNKAQIINNGSATTGVTNLVNGIYVFQLMVTDNDGAVGIAQTRVIVNGIVKSLLLQPRNNPDEVHITGYVSGQDVTYYKSQELSGFAWTINSREVRGRSIFKFDLSEISTAEVKSAKLSLYSMPNPINGNHYAANAGYDNAIFIERINAPWEASSVTWNNKPITTEKNRITVPHTDSAFLDLVEIDVTELVKDMVVEGNFGFGIRLRSEVLYTSRIFCSSKYADITKLPKLEVVYK